MDFVQLLPDANIKFQRYLWLWISLLHLPTSLPVLLCPAIPYEAYIDYGDFNIGALYSARDVARGDGVTPCGGPLTQFRFQQNIEAIVYAVEQINSNLDLLPNVSLGYVIQDDCRREVTALAKATRYIPVETCAKEGCSNESNLPGGYYDVIGVMGMTTSSKAVLVSSLLSIHQIPTISPEATSDALSGEDHNYFFRVVSPDENQALAIVSLLTKFNWTYVSMLYTEGVYGSNAARNLLKISREGDFCVAYYAEISSFTKVDDKKVFDRLVRNLRSHSTARAVILTLSVEHAQGLLEAVRRNKAIGEFIWLGWDSFDARAFSGYEDVAVGAISLAFSLQRNLPFKKHFESLTPSNNPNNPWYKKLWENLFHCSWEKNKNEKQCSQYSVLQARGYYFSDWTSKTIDAVYVFAHALHNLIKEKCSELIGNLPALKDCVTGPELRNYMKKVNFSGISGPITFDKNGNLIGNYLVKQLVLTKNAGDLDKNYDHTTIGVWERSSHDLHLNKDVLWYARSGKVIGRSAAQAPKSVCSETCAFGAATIPSDTKCCWTCQECRGNEIIIENGTMCDPCPLLMWPNSNLTKCEWIDANYLKWSDEFGIVLTSLAAIALGVLIAVSVVIAVHSSHRIIKASTVQQTTIILVGLYLTLGTSLFFMARPTVWSCSLSQLGFHFSCTMIYGPLFVKTGRIYRIFRASQKCRRVRTLVSLKAQMVSVIVIFIGQIIVMYSAIVFHNYTHGDSEDLAELFIPSRGYHLQPSQSLRYVELLCRRSKETLLPPLCFNIVILSLCDVFAFLTRQVPDAFNESWYIFLSVSTTLFIWMAFLPSYFVTTFGYHKEALLALAMILNAGAVLACLFAPKVYALYFVKSAGSKFSVDFQYSQGSVMMTSTIKKSLSTIQKTSTIMSATKSNSSYSNNKKNKYDKENDNSTSSQEALTKNLETETQKDQQLQNKKKGLTTISNDHGNNDIQSNHNSNHGSNEKLRLDIGSNQNDLETMAELKHVTWSETGTTAV